MEADKDKGKGCTGCISRLVSVLWIFLIGILGGAWGGFNLARMYPEFSIPQSIRLAGASTLDIPVVKDPFYAITTSRDVWVKVTDIRRLGELVEVSFTARNDAKTYSCASSDRFSLQDGEGRIFSSKFSFDREWCDNPGFSGTFVMECRVPIDATGVKVYYLPIRGDRVFMASVPD